jgi:hypothetical protein
MAAKSSTRKLSKYNADYLNREGNTYDDVINDKDCIKIINSIKVRFSPYIGEDDISSLVNFAIMDACKKYNPNHNLGGRFTTFLYQQVSFKLRSFLYESKKKYLKFKGYMREATYRYEDYDSSKIKYESIINSLTDEDKVFIEDKFINNFSTLELSEKYKVSEEEIRKRYRKIIRHIKVDYGVSLDRKKEKINQDT